MFKSYYQVRDWLEGFIPLVYGKEELGLARIEYLLHLLGNPQEKFKSIHVTGTSGKGSTAFYAARLLQGSQKIKVGLHLSPHLVDIRERVQIFEGEGLRIRDEGLMPMERFLRLFNEIKSIVEKIQKDKPELTPSYFEILVAASFLYFAQEKVDWAVVEVGLGGRLDATNVLAPEVSVITNIGLDHTEILGKIIEKIAFDKAGIIKKGVSVVTGASGRALQVIADVAKKQQSALITINTQDRLLANKLLAIEAVELALKRDKGAQGTEYIKGIEDISNLPGRFEEIELGVILDGA
ncbi:MAG: Mur ligase family protein, partial [Patescibacteria group bacterium]